MDDKKKHESNTADNSPSTSLNNGSTNKKLIQLYHKLIHKPYPYQLRIIQNNKPELIINKSRQIGISYAVAAWALIKAIFLEKNELIISPSLRQSKHMMQYIYEHLNTLKHNIPITLQEETKTSLIFPYGGAIHSLPNSANTIRGYPADDVWVDEFAHFTNGTDREIIEALAPSLSRGGNICYISTPFGDQNLFFNYWHNRPHVQKLIINWKQCPDFKPEKIHEIRQTIGEDAFQQEYNNQFLSDIEGQEFPMELIQTCINSELTYTDLQPTVQYIGGADIGRECDQTACVIFQKTGENLQLVNKHIMRQTPYQDQLNYFTYLLTNFTFTNFVVDESGIGNMLAEQLSIGRHYVEPVTFNNENKQTMVSNLKRLMTEQRLQYPDDPLLIANIRAIRRKYTPTNYLIFESHRDSEIGHADLFWALCLALKNEYQKSTYFLPIHD
jgi:phage FluMu gp28-like protein